MTIELQIEGTADYICDYTFNFYWHNNNLKPDSTVPGQNGTTFTYQDIVNELKAGGDVSITGNVGKNFAYSLGADIKHLEGSGEIEKAGRVFIDGNVGAEAGMGMVAGTLYIKGNIEYPLGNIIELVSDVQDYRKFRSITDILCNGKGNDELITNEFNESERTLILKDGVPRGTVAARCPCNSKIVIEGDAYNGTGMLARKATVIVNGNAGMNTGSHLNGGTVVVHGEVGEFAGAYMKDGKLIFLNAKGFIGAGMEGGAIYSKHKAKTSPPAAKSRMKGDDSKLMRELMDAGRVESMLYNKYEPEEEKQKYVEVHMRDGSIVMRKID
ncbi:formylmethanofuran dehydrogenase [Methanolobus bombayensis]|uniref:GltB/FmdC/FwdC-like GXGXG domain-containing protein n=1 Tax=Methanolobus bombayensis TaxID=38023 RepID=UPI001AE9590B|nr:formylmethanofuran dehydrogenase [Methanolobus bombayensis]MBP1909384.1 formylmethanofuran dehydrogenase subunit C [Methanolobus bombayensis]